MLVSGLLAGLFIPAGNSAYPLAQRMLLLTPLFMVPNLLMYILLRSFQAQEKTLLANVISFLDPFLTGVLVLILLPVTGPDTVWLSTAIVNIAILIFLVLLAAVRNGRLSLSLASLAQLEDGFGAPEGTWLEFTIFSEEDVILASEKAIAFCRSQGASERISIFSGLCLEEIAENVLQHGGFRAESGRQVMAGPSDREALRSLPDDEGAPKAAARRQACSTAFSSSPSQKPRSAGRPAPRFPGRHFHKVNRLDIRLVRQDVLKLRFRDNCREFNPTALMNMYRSEDPAASIGLRLVNGIASDVKYHNTAGINTLLITLPMP